MESQHPAAGWYKDPADPSRYRYWDGLAWTDRVRVPEAPTPPPPAPEPAPVAVEPTPAPVPVPSAPTAPVSPLVARLRGDTPRQRPLVVGAVLALAAIGVTVAVTQGGGGGFDLEDAYEACTDEVDDLPDTGDIGYQPVDDITVEEHGEDVALVFWAEDPSEPLGEQRIEFLCVGDDDGDVKRMYLRFDEIMEHTESRFDSVGSSIG